MAALLSFAPEQSNAREVVKEAFGVRTRFPPRRKVTTPPWFSGALVRAEMKDDPVYTPNGPDAVLEPSP